MGSMPQVPGNPAREILRPETPVQFIKGIGPRRAEALAAHGIHTVSDLLEMPPFRYEDRTQFRPLASLRDGEWVLTRAEICNVGGYDSHRRRISIFEMLVKDGSGSMRLKFFNQPYLRQVYRTGMKLVIYGQVKRDTYAHGALCLMNPDCEIIDEKESGPSLDAARIVPIYRKLGTLRPRTIRQILHRIIESLPQDLPDPLPGYLLKQYRLPSRNAALARIHFPEPRSQAPAERAQEVEQLNRGISPAHKRLIFEELFQLEVGIGMVRESRRRHRKEHPVHLDDGVRAAIKKILPFHPTGAQKRVLKEIAGDMCSPFPMSRLLQGDVGSGKTIVAAQAAVIAVENGFQAAVMAPTEILAEQHYFNFRRLLDPLGYRIDLLKGSLTAGQKRAVHERLRKGETRIAIGTHALISEAVAFEKLRLVIVDEQHRFGVIQRNILKEKGDRPDMLVMTATPIPRSLALTLYGDLEVSVIDEMPPGRLPVETLLYAEKERSRVSHRIRDAVAQGHQVYIVYPLVEESEKNDLRAAVETAERLQTRVFPDLRTGLLHGRMKSAEKEEVMRSFASGELDILVSTTVIEVGVDVANASLMVIEHAERFGLAQLHQLRGRVGRGADRSTCILIGGPAMSPEARRRLEIMCETNDGFRIAEVDLELRGPGEFIGTRQSGLPAFKFANLIRDRKALELARQEADRFLQRLRTQPDEECRRVALDIRRLWTDRFGLALVG